MGQGARRLKAALRRMFERLTAGPPVGPLLTPQDEWSRSVEARLHAVESKLSGQIRLLMLAILSLTADLVYRLTNP